MFARFSLICFLIFQRSKCQVNPPLSAGGPHRNILVDQSGTEVSLHCVNWYGAHMGRFVVNGLDMKPLDEITAHIAQMGFNCVRLVFSNELFATDPIITAEVVAANPALAERRASVIFATTVTSLTNAGLMVVLNNHISTAQWCCSEDDGNGLWYTKAYPQEQWQRMWVDLAGRFQNNTMVIAADLRNELREANGVNPEWGSGDPSRDWALAAESCGNAVLGINPNLLIIVEGLRYANHLRRLSLDQPFHVASHPVVLNVQNKLVYSAHWYSWDYDVVDTRSYDDFLQRLVNFQLYVTEPGKPYTAPFWLGEFGDNKPSILWNMTIKLLCEHSQLSWSYWAIDGYMTPDKDETFGIFNRDYSTIRHPWKLHDLQRLMSRECRNATALPPIASLPWRWLDLLSWHFISIVICVVCVLPPLAWLICRCCRKRALSWQVKRPFLSRGKVDSVRAAELRSPSGLDDSV